MSLPLPHPALLAKIRVLGTASILGAGPAESQARETAASKSPQELRSPAKAAAVHNSSSRTEELSRLDPRSRGRYSAFFVGASQLQIPNRLLSTFLRSYSNALCRPQPSARARAMGVNRSDRCNFGIHGGYRWVRGRYGIDAELSYSRFAMPTSNWVAAGEEIPAADYLELSFHAFTLAASIWRDIPLARRKTRWSWRFGAQLGLALVAGGAYRTKLGDQPPECTFETLGNLDLCRPYRPLEFNDGARSRRAFAECSTREGCNPHDLERAGRQRVDAVPPLIPWINLWTGPGFAIDARQRLSGRFSVGIGLGLGLSYERRLKF